MLAFKTGKHIPNAVVVLLLCTSFVWLLRSCFRPIALVNGNTYSLAMHTRFRMMTLIERLLIGLAVALAVFSFATAANIVLGALNGV